MFNRRLASFLPTVYDGVVEMQDIMNAEEASMDIARRELYSAFANTFVLTADESGVIMFEKMLNISADLNSESLEFRRQRIISRLAMRPPFTFRFLQQKLDEILGVGTWEAYIDHETYTLYIEYAASSKEWYTEVEFTVGRLKPCNIVFATVPRLAKIVSMEEEISYSLPVWKYRLGSWKLSQYPFSASEGGEIVKRADLKSIQPALLSDTAGFVADDIACVLINDTVRITEFKMKQNTDNQAFIEYAVTSDQTDLMTNIKLLRADDTVLTEADVYVPVTQTVVSRHIITVKEGA